MSDDNGDAVNDEILDQDNQHKQYNLEQQNFQVETFDHLYTQVNKVRFKDFLYIVHMEI